MDLTHSPAVNLLLHQMGIDDYFAVLENLPRRYESFVYTTDYGPFQDKQRVVFFGKITGQVKILRFSHRLSCKFMFSTEGHSFLIQAWNRDYLSRFLNETDDFTLSGSYDESRHAFNLLNIIKGKVDSSKALHPIYSLPHDLQNRTYISLVERALAAAKGRMPDKLPAYLVGKYRFVSHYEALRLCHQPASSEDLRQGLRVLKYEEALVFSLRNQLIRGQNTLLIKDRRRQIDREKLRAFVHGLPYSLTDDQKNVILESLADMDKPSLMYRLLQGDVGTGKTLVAAILMYANHLRSEQSAIMAPTDALARQHYATLKKIYEGTNVVVSLLVGGMSAADRHEALEDLSDGTTDIVVGTHALFSKDVEYAYLGLAIIDEQHKFGVNQRCLLTSKGEHADLLLMSATPIPRTLSLTLYGDLDVSSLTQFPQGKRKTLTKIIRSSSLQIQKDVAASISSSHRVYVVAPQIEENEDESLSSVKNVFDNYETLFPGRVSMLHGRMTSEEKETSIDDFRTGLRPILVSTSVIEVGIDIKEANLMVIYDPSHFALSSLHQLRGRIGRDGGPATCLLAYDGDDPDEQSKLDVLVSTDDGFKIAEEDLRRRGPGQLAGTMQSGLPDFRFANIIDDFKMFEYARDDAAYLLARRDEKQFASIIAEAEKETSGVSLA